MVPTDDGGHIPAIYGDFVEVYSKTKAGTLPPHWSTDHAIDLEPGYNLPYGADLQPIGVRVEDVKGLHRGKPSQWVYSAVIIAGGGANSHCKKEGWC